MYNMEEQRIDPSISYDIVELPSRGIHYPNKKKVIKVAYLTAADEDILANENFLKNNITVDEILKRKVIDKDINVDDLVEEDRRAILIFLRNTAFGGNYTVTLIDPKTEQPFKTVVNLEHIKMKDFNLVETPEGEYKYTLPKSNVDITFKFLNKSQENEIEKIKESWNGIGAPPIVTKQLEFMIKTVGGIRDMMQIRSFIIDKMPITDSQDFRKFVKENKPNIDLTQNITTPSGEVIQVEIGFGVEFFRPFYGLS